MNYQKIQSSFKANGFKFVKIELEAEVSPRDYCSDSSEYLEEFESEFTARFNLGDDMLKFIKVYNDGSVDTEVTMTLRVEAIDKLESIVSAFRATCLYFGQCSTSNAGLHITLLEGYQYPRPQGKELNRTKLANYTKEVSKLLYAINFIGSQPTKTRSYQFRGLQVSNCEKYSAIYTHNGTCLEYRLFDTCYQKPETIRVYLSLIAKTLKYYTDNEKKLSGLRREASRMFTIKNLRISHHRCYRDLRQVFYTDLSRQRLLLELDSILNEQEKSKEIGGYSFNTIKKLMLGDRQQLRKDMLLMQIKKLILS